MRFVGLLLLAASALAASPRSRAGAAPPIIADDPGEQIPGPANPGDPGSVDAWMAAMTAWRTRMRAKISYNGSIYEVPELKWTQTSYIQPQMHPYDRFFFDPVAGNYTVQKYLDVRKFFEKYFFTGSPWRLYRHASESLAFRPAVSAGTVRSPRGGIRRTCCPRVSGMKTTTPVCASAT